ncbi:pseudaminic acid synthase [Pseudorhodoplanes sp.]|uniref:pseudaminic acid synthase n=1 Tax=Pseudorhodoplanes sp. TaxID=1934341 RepID=UPI003D0E6097
MTASITIAGRPVGSDHPPYMIAEMSGNHNGELSRALEIVVAAKDAGADAVKLQTYTADTITIDHNGPGFTVEGTLWEGRTLYDLYDEAHTPWDWHRPIFDKARELGMPVFSSPFDFTAIDFLEDLGCPAYKIASFEAVDLPLIERAAATGKPVIISTGLASRDEIADAIAAAKKAAGQDPAILHCISTYPTEPGNCNLRVIPAMIDSFGIVVGFSDHTLGTAAAVSAVALGASIIEKHITLDRSDGGPDAAFSLEPGEFARMVEDCNVAFAARGHGRFERPKAEDGLAVFRRSLYVVEDVASGGILTPRNVRSIRPGYGLAPRHLNEVLGKAAASDLKRGTPLSWELIAK